MSELKKLLRSVKPRGGKVVIRHKYPYRVEVLFRSLLQDEVLRVARQIVEVVKPAISAEIRGDIRNDASVDILRAIKAMSFRYLAPETIVKRVAEELRRSSDKRIGDAFIKSMGVNVIPPHSDLSAIVDVWVEQNITTIKDMESAYLTKVQRTVAEGFKSGLSTRDIANGINSATGASMSKAKFIARNEVGSLNAEITEKRDKDLGIDAYVWRTMKDIRVRGAPSGGIGGLYPNAPISHVEREGETFEYADPPEGGNPGEDFLCRCYAEAVIEF
jgi:uncharacterized protein with gpF-like domain